MLRSVVTPPEFYFTFGFETPASLQPQPLPGGCQLATPRGTSGTREEKKVLKKTQAVHMTDTWWGGTNTAVSCSSPSDPSPAAGSSLRLSAASSGWRDRVQSWILKRQKKYNTQWPRSRSAVVEKGSWTTYAFVMCWIVLQRHHFAKKKKSKF